MPNRFTGWFLLILLALIWGSSFILMKLGMRHFSYDQVGALRLTFALAFVIPLWFFHIKKEHFSLWPWFLGSGVFGNLLPAFLFTYAETAISSSLTGMLNSFTPLATLLLGILFWKKVPNKYGKAGVLTGLVGAFLLFIAGEQSENNVLVYGSFVIAATICYGISVNIIQHRLNGVNPVTNTVWSMTFCGLPALLYLFYNEPFTILSQEGAYASLGYIAILGIFGSAVSVIFFNQLIRTTSGLFASSVTYLIPVVAVLWGLKFGEPVNWMQVGAMGVILGGIWLINKK